MTHEELVQRACRWLRGGSRRCAPVFAEFQHLYSNEMPDAIGWTGAGVVWVVEVKVSRSDFLADAKKLHRLAGVSMGHRRSYLVPKGLIGADEVPGDHGLLYASPKTIRIAKKAPPRDPGPRAAREAERILRQAVIRHERGLGWSPEDHRFGPVE